MWKDKLLEFNSEGRGWKSTVCLFAILVDSHLRVQTFFEKDGALENGSFDFEIRDIGTRAHLYWRLKKISCRACLKLYFKLYDPLFLDGIQLSQGHRVTTWRHFTLPKVIII